MSDHQKDQFKENVLHITRQDGDIEYERTMPTASSEQILKNLTKTHTYWKNFGIPPSTEKAFKLAYQHVTKNCLNDIPVGLGTERNEATHKWMNDFYHGRATLSAEVFEVWRVVITS